MDHKKIFVNFDLLTSDDLKSRSLGQIPGAAVGIKIICGVMSLKKWKRLLTVHIGLMLAYSLNKRNKSIIFVNSTRRPGG